VVTVGVENGMLHLSIEGMDKLWAIRSTLEVPLVDVSGVTVEPSEVHDWWKGFRVAGAQMPGLIAGSFYYHGRSVFWDVHNPEMTIGIMLHDEHYSELVIEVENPGDVAEMIQQALESEK
jgi:hypothetical protein